MMGLLDQVAGGGVGSALLTATLHTRANSSQVMGGRGRGGGAGLAAGYSIRCKSASGFRFRIYLKSQYPPDSPCLVQNRTSTVYSTVSGDSNAH